MGRSLSDPPIPTNERSHQRNSATSPGNRRASEFSYDDEHAKDRRQAGADRRGSIDIGPNDPCGTVALFGYLGMAGAEVCAFTQ
jgi:hypothetical protein